MEQMTLSMLLSLQDGESLADLERQANLMSEYGKQKHKWENAFQKWSDDHGIEAVEHIENYGCCGYGSMCDWCTDNSYGRPCVRALNAMCRKKGIKLDYSKQNFKEIWRGEL